MKRLLFVLVLIGFVTPTYGQLGDKISPRQWANDLQVLNAEILEPLDQEMQGQDCPDNPNIFYQAFFEKLKTLRSKISSLSYLMIRDSILGASSAMVPFFDRIDCKKIGQWEFFRTHVYAQIDFVGDLLTIIDVAKGDDGF